jgi:hypothetical protein
VQISACEAKPGKTGLTGEPGESGVNWLNPIREPWTNFVMVFDGKRSQYEL